MDKEFWTISFNDSIGKWVAGSNTGRILDGATPGELMAALPKTAGLDKTAEFRVVITGR